MTGLVGVIANDSARYSLFSVSIDRLWLPEGARKEWLIGGDWCGARNKLVAMTLESEAEWLWFMDDDHAFSADLLAKLLRWQLPLVMPICLTRTAPFLPVQFTDRIPDAEYQYLPIFLDEYPDDALVKLEAGGCAGMLIRREVLAAIEPPWFEYGDRSEDIVFCEKVRAAGFEIHADLSARLGHITTSVVWPAVKDGDWVTGITVGREMQLFVPLGTTGVEEVEAA